MARSLLKRHSMPHVIREMKIKTAISTTKNTVEWPKSRPLISPYANEDVGQQEFSHIAGGKAKWTANLEDSLSASYKTKHTHNHIIQLSHYLVSTQRN